MTARSGMSDLITQLRGMANAGTAEYVVDAQTFWSDDHLQNILDENRNEHFRLPLVPIQTYLGGTVVYLDYFSDIEHLEQTTGGTAIFIVETSAGSVVPSSGYTPDYRTGQLSFAADTGGSPYYLTAREYDLNRSAAQVFRQKASHYAGQVTFATDNHRVELGTLYKHCLEMADYYEQRSQSTQVVQLYRSDNYPA